MIQACIHTAANDKSGSWWRRALPPARWLAGYRPRWLALDLLAGVTLAAYAIPVSLAYASLAGLPPQHGVYCYLIAGLCYALLGTSRQLALGPTSAISMVLGLTIAGMAGGDPARWVDLAALTALVMAGISLLAGLLRLSSLINFISESILLGFKAGAALTIGMTQLPKMLGVAGGGSYFFESAGALAGQLGNTNHTVLLFGLAILALLILGEKLLPGRPVALMAVVLSIMALSLTRLGTLGIPAVGEVPSGLPSFHLPALRLRDVDGILPLALACFLLAYIESVSAARAIAMRNGEAVDPRQELFALGLANLATGLGQGYPVAGGLSQSMVNVKAGAKTPLALVFASVAIGLCLIFLTGLLRALPNVALAAIVLVAVSSLIDIPALRRLWRLSRFEFSISMVALVGVLVLGILKGVLLAVVASLLLLLRRAARPHVAFLGRVPGTRRFTDIGRHPDNELIPGTLIFRVESGLLYFNVEHVCTAVHGKLGSMDPLPRRVICDLSTTPYVDVAGAGMLERLRADLTAAGIEFLVVEAHAPVRDILRAIGLEERMGHISRKVALEDVVGEE